MVTQALLFDFDGTLVNSEIVHLKLWNELLKPQHLELTTAQYESEFAGLPVPAVSRVLCEQFKLPISPKQLSEQKTHLTASFFREQAAPLMPNALETLQQAYAQRFRLALVTGTARAELMPNLVHHQLNHFFEIIVTRDDVEHSKPHPASYELALKKLKLNHEAAIALEDSAFGVQSALSAGIKVIAIEKKKKKRQDLSQASFQAKNLKQAWQWIKAQQSPTHASSKA